MERIKRFVKDHKIRADCTLVSHNPDTEARHYKVQLQRRTKYTSRRRLTTQFSVDLGRDEPTATLVLQALASDSGKVEATDSFESWCNELRLKADTRNKELYRMVSQQRERLRDFLGDNLYRELVFGSDNP